MSKIPIWRKLSSAVALAVFAGCGESEQPTNSTTNSDQRPAANVALRIAVVNDAELTAAISKMRGEWQEQAGGELTIDEISLEQTWGVYDTDLLVFPSRYLGELCEAGRLRPMRTTILESAELDFADILPLVREREIVYGQQVMALPIGCPTPLVASGKAKPDLAAAPLADQYAAFALLARAAPLARHPNREAIWFDPETMEPRLTEPPFLRALTELMEATSGVVSPCQLAEQLLRGEVSAATVWPCRQPANGRLAALSVRQLPPATQNFNPTAGQWESTAPRQVTLLATSGGLVGVTSKSRNAASAFRFAGWLASPEIVGHLATASDGLAICRESQRRMADNWLRSGRGAATTQFSHQLADALSQREGVTVPRILGVDRYLDSLATAVRAAATGSATPEKALAAAAQNWDSITGEIGRERQRMAYRRCLGIEP